MTTAPAPNAAADLSTAPTLRGSLTWSSTTTSPSLTSRSARLASGRGQTSAARPWCGTSVSSILAMSAGSRTSRARASCAAVVCGRLRMVSGVATRRRIRRAGLANAASTGWRPQSQKVRAARSREACTRARDFSSSHGLAGHGPVLYRTTSSNGNPVVSAADTCRASSSCALQVLVTSGFPRISQILGEVFVATLGPEGCLSG